jgi:hypothetical protein
VRYFVVKTLEGRRANVYGHERHELYNTPDMDYLVELSISWRKNRNSNLIFHDRKHL